MSEFLNFWISESLNFWISEFLNFWISEFIHACCSESEILHLWMSEFLNFWISECLNFWISEFLNFWISGFLKFSIAQPSGWLPWIAAPPDKQIASAILDNKWLNFSIPQYTQPARLALFATAWLGFRFGRWAVLAVTSIGVAWRGLACCCLARACYDLAWRGLS